MNGEFIFLLVIYFVIVISGMFIFYTFARMISSLQDAKKKTSPTTDIAKPLPLEEIKDSFYLTADRFIKNDLLKVIFECDQFCICNAADYFYCLIPFDARYVGDEFGFLITKEHARKFIDLGRLDFRIIGGKGVRKFTTTSFDLNDGNFTKLMHMAELTKNGPTSNIDRELEAYAMANCGLLQDETVSCG